MKAVFLDRDGTIGGTGGGIHPFEFSLYEFAPKAIKSLNEIGIKVFLFTNQTRVGRGYFTEDDCNCQKPNIGMLIKGKEKYNLNLNECYVVGDTGDSDMLAADLAGTKKVLVKTGWGKGSLTTYRSKWKNVEPDYIANNLVDAVCWISSDLKKI